MNTILLDKHEVAEMLNISLRTVDNLREKGTLPFVKLGYIVRFKRKDVESMIDARRFSRGKPPLTTEAEIKKEIGSLLDRLTKIQKEEAKRKANEPIQPGTLKLGIQ